MAGLARKTRGKHGGGRNRPEKDQRPFFGIEAVWMSGGTRKTAIRTRPNRRPNPHVMRLLVMRDESLRIDRSHAARAVGALD
jgi:hypothetical protein